MVGGDYKGKGVHEGCRQRGVKGRGKGVRILVVGMKDGQMIRLRCSLWCYPRQGRTMKQSQGHVAIKESSMTAAAVRGRPERLGAGHSTLRVIYHS